MPVDVNQLASQDSAFLKQAAAARQAEQDKQNQPEPSFLQKWVTGPVGRVTTQALDAAVSAADQIYDTPGMRKSRDIVSGVVTGATNIADSVLSHAAPGMAAAGDMDDSFAEQRMRADLGVTNEDLMKAGGPIWDHAKGHILDFRDAVAVHDPTLSDGLIQGVSQLAIPFAGYSRALGGLNIVTKAVASGALTDATALAPHDMRLADLLALGRHTEGKLGTALRTLAPDGSAFNAYINYLTDRSNESEAEGRFKNVLDGFGANLIATPLIHGAASVLKQGTSLLRGALESGASKFSDLVPKRPPLQQGGSDPADPLFEEQVRRDMANAAANPNGQRPPLRQGADPADPLFEEQVRRDMGIEPSAELGRKGKDNPYADSSLNSSDALTSFRKVLQSQAGTLGDLTTPGTANTVDLKRLTSALAKHMPGDEEGSFYKDVLERVAAKNPTADFRVSSEPHPEAYAGAYNPARDAASLYPIAFENNGQLAHTFTHEAVHAAVYHDVETNPGVRDSLETLRKIVESSTATRHYGTTNVHEFVAEAESNPAFRQAMKKAKTDYGSSVWDTYKHIIGQGILGISGVAAMSPMFEKLLTKDEEKSGA